MPPSSEPVAVGVLHLDDSSLRHGLRELRWGSAADPLDARPPLLVVELGNLDRFSARTLAALLVAQRRCQARGGRMVLHNPSRACREALTRLGLSHRFATTESKQPVSDDPTESETAPIEGAHRHRGLVVGAAGGGSR